MSTFPRNSSQGKVLRSVQIGAASKSPASIFETKFAQAKASISLKAIVRKLGIAQLSPRSMPPYPAQRLTCVTALVVSMSCRLILGFRLDECFLNYLWASVKIILDVVVEHLDCDLGDRSLVVSADASSVRWLRTLVHGELAWANDEESDSTFVQVPTVLLRDDRHRLELDLLDAYWHPLVLLLGA